MQTLALPLSFSNGEAVVYSDTEDLYYSHLLALNLQIEPNELPLSSEFGTFEMTLNDESRSDAIELAASYIPEISLEEIALDIDDNGRETVSVIYSR